MGTEVRCDNCRHRSNLTSTSNVYYNSPCSPCDHYSNFEEVQSAQAAGIERAKARGVYKGRPKSIDRGLVLAEIASGESPSNVARELGIGRSSVYRILDESPPVWMANPTEPPLKTSDGGSTDYYTLPPGATELNDLIEHKAMSFALGNIFKACYRFGEKDAASKEYDINKIIFFAERIKTGLGKSK